jgi:hypothetical protein
MSTATAAHARYAGLPAETLLRMLIEKRKETDAIIAALLAETMAPAPAQASTRRFSIETTSSTLSEEYVADFRPLSALLPPCSPLTYPLSRESTLPALSPLTVEEMEPTHYTASEVAAMTDGELLIAVRSICGITHLSCTHCCSTSLTEFVESIRQRCSKPWRGKSGLFPEVELPRTCNAQTETNNLTNPINNKYSRLIKKATSPEEIEALKMQRSEEHRQRLLSASAAGGAGAGAGAH